MARQGYEWAVTKSGAMPPNVKCIGKDDYPHHERASTVYTHYITGYTQEEIVRFMNAQGIEVDLAGVEMDIQHIQALLPCRTLIAHENDRNRLLLHRAEGEKYRRLLGESLEMKAKEYVEAGLSPTGPLKEFREAVGMTEKPGGINVHVSQQNLNMGGAASASGVSSSEDLLRRVMSRMKTQQALSPPTEQPIETEATAVPDEATFEDYEDDSIPDPDE